MSGFSLSIHNCSSWGIREATRELIANLHDALSSVAGSRKILYTCSSENSDDKKFYTAHYDDLTTPAVGRIMWLRHNSTLTLMNFGVSLTQENISNIGSTKKRGSGSIGQFGEGLKSALAPFARAGCKVIFLSPNGQWVCTSVQNPTDPEDKLLRLTKCSPIIPEYFQEVTNWTSVSVTNITDPAKIAFEDFRFLQQPPRAGIDIICGKATPAILQNPVDSGNIYVQEVLVCHRPELPFGLSLDSRVQLTRDRSNVSKPIEVLLINAFNADPADINAEALDFIYELLNKKKGVLSLSRYTLGTFGWRLFGCGLAKGDDRQLYTCTPRSDMTPEQRKLLSQYAPATLVSVHHHLFEIMWRMQESTIVTDYDALIASFLEYPIEKSALSAQESKKMTALQGFVSKLFPEWSIDVVIVDSSRVISSKPMSRLAVIDRLPCLWESGEKRLIVDRKLLNNRNVHNRLKVEIEREAIADPRATGSWSDCDATSTQCNCLHSSVMTLIQESESILTTYKNLHMLRWSTTAPDSGGRRAKASRTIGVSDDEIDYDSDHSAVVITAQPGPSTVSHVIGNAALESPGEQLSAQSCQLDLGTLTEEDLIDLMAKVSQENCKRSLARVARQAQFVKSEAELVVERNKLRDAIKEMEAKLQAREEKWTIERDQLSDRIKEMDADREKEEIAMTELLEARKRKRGN